MQQVISVMNAGVGQLIAPSAVCPGYSNGGLPQGSRIAHLLSPEFIMEFGSGSGPDVCLAI